MVETVLVGPDVRTGLVLVRALDDAGMRPRAVLWVYSPDIDAWRLWITPPAELSDKREFYLRLADVFAKHRAELEGLDLGEVQFTPATHPVIAGLSRIFRVAGTAEIRFTNNVLNGYFLPDAVILRMAL